MQSTITVSQIIKAIANLSGVFLDERCAPYLQAQRGPLLTAIEMEDGEAVASTVTRAIQAALSGVGFKGHLTPDLLRKLIDEPTVGVRAIHDAIEKRENALFHLTTFVQQAGRGGFAGAQRQPSPQPPQRNMPQPLGGTGVPQRTGHHAAEPRSVPAPVRNQESRPPYDRGQSRTETPHRGHDDNPLPVGRQGDAGMRRSTYGQHPPQHEDREQFKSEQPPAPSRASISNLDEQRAARHSYADRRDDDHEVRGGNTEEIQNRRREQKNVYGSKASIQFSAGTTKATDRKLARPTIYMEAARLLNAQNRTYDWNNKLVLQLTAHELQIVTALLFGLITSCKFANHGHPGDADKWFEFAHQEGQYAGTIKIAIGKGSDVLICSMGAEDIGDVTAMFLRQCAEQMRIDQAAVPATLRVVAQAYNARNAAKSGARQQGSQGTQSGRDRRYG